MRKQVVACDRCGNDASSGPQTMSYYPGQITIGMDGRETYNAFEDGNRDKGEPRKDLCRNCYDALIRWFKAGNE